ncbi:hypothetical protein CN918_30220 [Priestia megaterium]|nr:hypothetical protein CN918_30220 [Priestia megaterium]
MKPVNALSVKERLIQITLREYKKQQEKGQTNYTIGDAFVYAQEELDTDDMHPNDYVKLEQEIVQAVKEQL